MRSGPSLQVAKMPDKFPAGHDSRVQGQMPSRDVGPFSEILTSSKDPIAADILRCLRELKACTPEGRMSAGICSNLTMLGCRDTWSLAPTLQTAFAEWPEFSGHPDYPVPLAGWSPEAAYYNFPSWEGEYGAARMRLLDFLIGYFEERTNA